MADDYLWNRSGPPDPDTQQLEELLAPLAHDAPLDELRLAKGRRSEPVHATAQEPVEAPPPRGREKGNMNIFQKTIIGAAALTATAGGLFAVTAYKHHVDEPEPFEMSVAFTPENQVAAKIHALAMAPHEPPVAPIMGADVAITAGESAFIHVPFGAVDVEIQSKCDADVELSVPMGWKLLPGPNPGDPPTLVPLPAGHAEGKPPPEPPIIAGTDRSDGRASRYHLAPYYPDQLLDGYQYRSRCAGQPLMYGMIFLDRDPADGPIGPRTNARVFLGGGVSLSTLARGMHVFGTVMPGARVWVGAKPVALEPVDSMDDDPPIDSRFSVDIPVSLDHLAAAVRVDDAHGTHFYVIHQPDVYVESCATTMTAPKQAAAKLDAQGDHAAALREFKAAMAMCKPDRETLSLALEYACKAGDVEAARTYWRKVPTDLQRDLEPVCARNQILRDALDRP